MANQIYTPNAVHYFGCSVLLSGFLKSPAFKDVLDKITTSAIYSIRKFSHKQAQGGEFHIVHVVFMLKEDAAAFASQYPKSALEIGGQQVNVFYNVDATISIPKKIHDDMDTEGDPRTITIWAMVETFPEGERCARGECACFAASSATPSNSPHEHQHTPGYTTPSEIKYVAHFGLPTFKPRTVVQIMHRDDAGLNGSAVPTSFGLVVEYASVEACVAAFEKMAVRN